MRAGSGSYQKRGKSGIASGAANSGFGGRAAQPVGEADGVTAMVEFANVSRRCARAIGSPRTPR
jgi:hypothetical protein